jgi:hypothetical protein
MADASAIYVQGMRHHPRPTTLLALVAISAFALITPAAGRASPRTEPATSAVAHSVDAVVSPAGKRLARTADGAPLPAAGRTEGIAGGYVFVPIAPFRTLDSREFGPAGFLIDGDEVWFDVLTDRTGAGRIPPEAVAVTYNLAITSTIDYGFLGMFPANVSWPGNASINWSDSGQTFSNGGTVALGYYDAPGQVAIRAGSSPFGGTFLVLDITGYYI